MKPRWVIAAVLAGGLLYGQYVAGRPEIPLHSAVGHAPAVAASVPCAMTSAGCHNLLTVPDEIGNTTKPIDVPSSIPVKPIVKHKVTVKNGKTTSSTSTQTVGPDGTVTTVTTTN